MFWERFYDLCNSIKSKPNPVGKKLGIASGAISAWKAGTMPDREALVKISDYFDCSVDYLLGRTNNPTSHMDSGEMAGLNSEEKRLIEGYRELNDEGKKQAVIYVTEFLLQNARFTQKSDSHDVKEA